MRAMLEKLEEVEKRFESVCQDLSDLGVDGYEAENTVQVTKP